MMPLPLRKVGSDTGERSALVPMKLPWIALSEGEVIPLLLYDTASKVLPVITLRSASAVPPIVVPAAPLRFTPMELTVEAVGRPSGPTPMKLPETITPSALTTRALSVKPSRSRPWTRLPTAVVASKVRPSAIAPPPVMMMVRAALSAAVSGFVLGEAPAWL